MSLITSLFFQWGVLSTVFVIFQVVLFVLALFHPLGRNSLRYVVVAGYVFIVDCFARIFYVLTSAYGPESQRELMGIDLLSCVLLAMIIPSVFVVFFLIKYALTSLKPFRLLLFGLGSLAILEIGVITIALLLAAKIST